MSHSGASVGSMSQSGVNVGTMSYKYGKNESGWSKRGNDES